MADFIVEMSHAPQGSPQPVWTLYVDSFSNSKAVGARIVLEGPGYLIIEKLLRFEFKTSNNQVEYEALLAELELAWDMGWNT